MAGKTYAFRTTELEENFLKQEVEKKNISPSDVIKKLIRNAIEGKNVDDQIEILKSELGGIKRFVKLTAKSATFAKYMATANYDELVQSNPMKIKEMKKTVGDLTKEEMEKNQ